MTEFTPIASTIGGLLIGASAAIMLLFNGRIAGISGIVGGILGTQPTDRPWRFAFLLGLVGGGLLGFGVMPTQFGVSSTPLAGLVAAGLFVGIGTRLGSGCTSGHGVCGLSRMSPRSIAATGIFMTAAAITVFLHLHVFGGAS
jgi:uncharacterized membrane protein YedE/YeeE